LVTILSLAAVYCASYCPPSLSQATATTGQSRTAKANQKEWILEQKQLDVGPVTVYLTTDAVKIMVPDSRTQIMAQGPDWKVHCINLTDKTEWVGNMSEFSGTCLFNPFALPVLKETKDMRADGIVKKSGLSCIKYEHVFHPDNLTYTTTEIDVNPKCAELLDRYYFLNHLPNVPVYAIQFRGKPVAMHKEWCERHVLSDLREGLVISLSTKSCRQKPFNAADFSAPQHCRRLPRLVEVAYSNKGKKDMKELIDSIGFSSDGRSKGEVNQKSEISKTAK